MPGMGGPGAPAPEARPRRRGVLLPTIIVLALLVGSFVVFTGFYTDWLWFVSVDKTEVFTTSLVTRALMFGVFGTIMGLAVGDRHVDRLAHAADLPRDDAGAGQPRALPRRPRAVPSPHHHRRGPAALAS